MGNKSTRARSSSTGVRRRRLESFGSNANKDSAMAVAHSTILLLGCGDAGKTTLCNRWRLWVEQTRHTKLEPELREKHLVADTLKKYLEHVIRHIILEESDYGDGAVNNLVHNFMEFQANMKMVPFTKEVGEKLRLMWDNPVFQREFRKRYKNTETELSLDYYFSDFERFYSKKLDLKPEDILHCKVRSTGITTKEFYTVNKRNIQIIDVAGQRAERHKWNFKMTTSNLVIYLCAVSEFDLTLFEDNKTNRLSESLSSFEDLMNEPDLYDTKILLLFTKIDLFEKKIRALKDEGKSVTKAFPSELCDDLEETMSPHEVLEVIEAKFKEKAADNLAACVKVNLLDVTDNTLFDQVNQVLVDVDLENSNF